MTHQVGVKGWSTTITFISGCAVFTCLQVELERSTSSWQLVSFQRTHNFLHHPREPNASNMLEENLYLSPTIINSKTPKKSQKIIIQSHPMASSQSPNPIRSHQIPGAKAASSMAGSCSPLATHPMCPASVPGCSAEAQSLCSRQSFTKLFGSLEVQLLDG